MQQNLKLDTVATVVTVASEELAELVVAVVHGVLLEALVQQVQPVALELLELKVVQVWFHQVIQTEAITQVPQELVVLEETLEVAETLVVLLDNT